MTAAGIVCEYNPFHEGHKYHIQKVREVTGADTVVAVMNGDFVQRGEPAVVNKYIRTRMALSEGADMVFELPVRYGLSSAEDFAYGGILALHSLSFVDCFCFGSEGAPIQEMMEAGHFFAEEPSEYQVFLGKFLREGLSFPAAREKAFAQCTGMGKSARAALFTPNNILGMEYIKSAQRLGTSMKPVIIERKGMGYHEAGGKERESRFWSATAIRKRIGEGELCGMPLRALEEFKTASCYLQPEDFWKICSYAIRDKWESLEQIKDISEELANAFRKNWYGAVSLQNFAESCKTKNITMGRIKRCLFQTLLDIEKESEREETLPYIRLLGMKKEAAPHLREVTGTVILGRLAKDREQLEERALKKLQQDIKASDIYHSVEMSVSGNVLPEEFKRPVIVLESKDGGKDTWRNV